MQEAAKAKDAIVFLSEKLVLRNDALGYKSKDANGVSIHFPLFYLNYKPKYEHLSFSASRTAGVFYQQRVLYPIRTYCQADLTRQFTGKT